MANTIYDPKFDTGLPTPELIDEFITTFEAEFTEAREAGAAIESLKQFGAKYLTRREIALIQKYGRRSEREAVQS